MVIEKDVHEVLEVLVVSDKVLEVLGDVRLKMRFNWFYRSF